MSQTNFEKLEKDEIIELFNELFEDFYQKTDKWSELVVQEFITKDPIRLANIEKYLPDFDDDLAEMIRYQLFNNNAYLQYQKLDDLIYYLQNPEEIETPFRIAYRFWLKEHFDYNCRSCTKECNFLEANLQTEINHVQKTFLCPECVETAPRGADGRKINQGKTDNSKVVRLQKKDDFGLEVPDYDLKALCSRADRFVTQLGDCVMDLPNIKELLQPNRLEIPFLDELEIGMAYHGWNNKPGFDLHTRKCKQTKYCEQKILDPHNCSNQGCI